MLHKEERKRLDEVMEQLINIRDTIDQILLDEKIRRSMELGDCEKPWIFPKVTKKGHK